jgi:hypothetical protein
VLALNEHKNLGNGAEFVSTVTTHWIIHFTVHADGDLTARVESVTVSWQLAVCA